jgi:hypothetical protein
MEDIILQYTWPRIDAEVSKHRNHLLKAPFCIHPKTGRVCVPVDPTRIDEFDPVNVPTVGQLLKEIDEAMVVGGEDAVEEAQNIPGKPSFGWGPFLWSGGISSHRQARGSREPRSSEYCSTPSGLIQTY